MPGSELFDMVAYLLCKRFSPELLAGKQLSMEFPKFEDTYVCSETIYNAVYALPVGVARSPTWSASMCIHQRLKIG